MAKTSVLDGVVVAAVDAGMAVVVIAGVVVKADDVLEVEMYGNVEAGFSGVSGIGQLTGTKVSWPRTPQRRA